MPYNVKEAVEFAKHVCTYFDAKEEDVHTMIDREADDIQRDIGRTYSESVQMAIVNCRTWIEDSRREFKPSDLISYRTPTLYFKTIKQIKVVTTNYPVEEKYEKI